MSKDLTTVTGELSKWDDKFDLIIRWYNDDTDRIKLPKALQNQLERWNWVFAMLNLRKNRYKRDTDILKIICKQYPGLTERTARNTLRDTRRLFGILDQPNLAFERVMLIASMKDTMRKARAKGDLKSLTMAEKNFMLVIGADQPENPVDNRTIINVINYNPVQIGGDGLSEDQLDTLIRKMMAADKKKQETVFDDFDDVSDTKPTS